MICPILTGSNYFFPNLPFALLVYSSSLVYVSTAIFFAKFLLEQLACQSSISLAEDGSPVHIGVLDTVVGVELVGGS